MNQHAKSEQSQSPNERLDDLRLLYRKFLNSPIGRSVDPKLLLPQLISANLINEDDAKGIDYEATLSQRQYWLFIRLLPTLGPEITERLVDILKLVGHGRAAGVLRTLIETYHISSSSSTSTQQTRKYSKSSRVQQFSFQKLARSTSNGSSGFSEDSSLPSPISENGNADIAFPAPVFTRLARTFRVEHHDESDSASFASAALENFSSRAVRLAFDVTPPALEPSDISIPNSRNAAEPSTPENRFDELANMGAMVSDQDIEMGEMIGRGSFAVVYAGVYKSRKVAVKQFREYDDFTLAMFCDEVSIMRELNHSNVLQFTAFSHKPKERLLWLITEYVSGGSMRRFCILKKSATRKLNLNEKLNISAHCWRGLDYLHSKALCHKDISPDNVLISNDLHQVKISDFGLAEFKQLMTTTVTQVTGTPMYYPPEFASESGIIRHPTRSDVYSMGASLAELYSEQWFWSLSGGKPRAQFQVMFVLSEQRRAVEKGVNGKQPDCWPFVPLIVKTLLQDAIAPDYRNRKDAVELLRATEELILTTTIISPAQN